MLNTFGKSTRVLLHNVGEVYSHIQDLVLSMGYSISDEWNLTGESCKMNSIEYVNNILRDEQYFCELFERPMNAIVHTQSLFILLMT